MTKTKLISFGVALAATSAVAIGAVANQQELLFRTGATFEPYYCIYGDVFAKPVQDEANPNVSFARTRELSLGFKNFTFNDGVYAKYESQNDFSSPETVDMTKYAAIWNVEPIHGLLGGSIITKHLFESDGETDKTFYIYAIFSDESFEDPTDYSVESFTHGIGLSHALFHPSYGVLSGENLAGGDPCSVVPDSLEEPIELIVADGTNSEGVWCDIARYLGSFEYFYIAIFGNIAIDTVSIAYTCQSISDDFIYHPTHSHFYDFHYNENEHWYECSCGSREGFPEPHTFDEDGICTSCHYQRS
ncbi:MAG: hypothetical protein MJ248_05455 [Bacilli bacterium]|nr:hypothetical protein [Bacilli bacterium]